MDNYNNIIAGGGYRNQIFITAQKIYTDYISKLSSNFFYGEGSNGYYGYFSDDVIFTRQAMLIVSNPTIFNQATSAKIKIRSGNQVKVLERLPITKYIEKVGGIDYEYLTLPFTIPFLGNHSLQIEVFIITPIGPKKYVKNIVLIDEVRIDFFGKEGIITKKFDEDISITVYGKFSPNEFHVIPFDFTPDDGISALGDTKTFRSSPIKIENKDELSNVFFFNIKPNFENLPFTEKIEDNTIPSLSTKQGMCDSYSSKINLVLKSSINRRSSVEEGKLFQRRYVYMADSDYFFEPISFDATIVGAEYRLKRSEFKLRPKQKPALFGVLILVMGYSLVNFRALIQLKD
jgi:hypothetical protein